MAWVTERKDVLGGLFFMLTLGAYLGYVRRPFSWARYALLLVLLALGLMAKPMLVTLPFVLLLLDYWPLGCMGGERGHGAWRSLLVEKMPLFVLVAGDCLVMMLIQDHTLVSGEHLPLGWRLGNAASTTLPIWASSFARSAWSSSIRAGNSLCLGGRWRRRFASGGRYGGGLRPPQISVPARRLALVCGHVGAGDRALAGGLHVPAPIDSPICRRWDWPLP